MSTLHGSHSVDGWTMWEAVSVREELVEVEIFSIKVGEEEYRVSQPRNFKDI